jgi:hypothetical protein
MKEGEDLTSSLDLAPQPAGEPGEAVGGEELGAAPSGALSTRSNTDISLTLERA